MPRNEWFHIAEVMQQREHALINAIKDCIDNHNGEQPYYFVAIEDILKKHLESTGRRPDIRPQIKELSEVDSDTRSKLLKLLGASERQETVFSQPVEVRQVKLTKAGVPRKQRSDKGKARGKRGGAGASRA